MHWAVLEQTSALPEALENAVQAFCLWKLDKEAEGSILLSPREIHGKLV
jgi:hypothetical protein